MIVDTPKNVQNLTEVCSSYVTVRKFCMCDEKWLDSHNIKWQQKK